MIDISVVVSPTTPEWPGDTPFSCGWTWDMAKGASVNVSTVTMSPHVGTHADAPLHVRNTRTGTGTAPSTDLAGSVDASAFQMVADTSTNAPKTMTSTSKTDGSASATQGSISGAHELPLDVFLGPVVVLDVSDLHGTIEFDPLMQRLATILPSGRAPQIVPRLLLKTGQTIANQKFPAEWPALSPQCAEQLAQDGLVLVGVDCPSVDDRESKTLAVHHALFDNGAYILENLDLRAAEPGQYELIAFPLKLKDLDAAPVRAVLLHPSDLQ